MALTQVKGSAFPEEQTLQPGMIMMWAGAENQVPTGWKLCNGSGSTSNGIQVPDLRNRFVIGSGSSYDTGDTGGATSHTTSTDGSHSHNVTVNAGGNHSHTITVNDTTLSEGQMASHRHGGSATFRSDTEIFPYGEGAPPANKRVSYNETTSSANIAGWSGNAGVSSPHTHTATSNNTGSHTHTASSNNTGNHSHTVTTMPPYYALAYIIKL